MTIPASCINELFKFLEDITEIQTGKKPTQLFTFTDGMEIRPNEWKYNFDRIKECYIKSKVQ